MRSAIPIAPPCVTAVSAVLGLAACSAPGVARRPLEAVAGRPIDCAAILDAAALRAMGQTGPLGPMQVFGDPVAFGPNLRRVEIDVFGGGGQYDVDLTIDGDCNVLAVTTRLASNGPP